MEETWTLSGICGRWRCTVGIDPEDTATHTLDPDSARSALDALRQHFLTVADLLETKVLWELDDRRRR